MYIEHRTFWLRSRQCWYHWPCSDSIPSMCWCTWWSNSVPRAAWDETLHCSVDFNVDTESSSGRDIHHPWSHSMSSWGPSLVPQLTWSYPTRRDGKQCSTTIVLDYFGALLTYTWPSCWPQVSWSTLHDKNKICATTAYAKPRTPDAMTISLY